MSRGGHVNFYPRATGGISRGPKTIRKDFPSQIEIGQAMSIPNDYSRLVQAHFSQSSYVNLVSCVLGPALRKFDRTAPKPFAVRDANRIQLFEVLLLAGSQVQS